MKEFPDSDHVTSDQEFFNMESFYLEKPDTTPKLEMDLVNRLRH